MITRTFLSVLACILFFPVTVFATTAGTDVQILTEPLVFTEAMAVSGIVLFVTFIGIFTEHVHGMERSKFATGCAAAMVIGECCFIGYDR